MDHSEVGSSPSSAVAADPLDSAIAELETQVVHCRAILAFLEQKLQKKKAEKSERAYSEDDDFVWDSDGNAHDPHQECFS